MFRRMNIKDWRQFSDIDIEFNEHLTILTGANGAGKTTILNLLSQTTGWTPQFVSSVEKDESGNTKYSSSIKNIGNRVFTKIRKILPSSTQSHSNSNDSNKLGELEFTDASISDLILPQRITNGTYNVTLRGNHSERGVYINSHRPTFPYKPINSIPTAVATRNQIFSKYNDFNRSFINDTYRDPSKLSATALIKETLASLAIFGYGSQTVTPNENARALFEGFTKILKIVLPPKLGFNQIVISIPEVLLSTDTGDFPIDAVSGGISSIIDITWQLFMFGDPSESFIALIDEPENHLHPELQKSFLGNLIKAFPHVQFVVATHNPFMISAVKDSNVYVLDYNDQHRVCSKKLDYINRAGTSNAILREVLGIDTTIPFWAEDQLKSIVDKYLAKEFTQETLTELRNEMKEIGLADFIPETIARIAGEH